MTTEQVIKEKVRERYGSIAAQHSAALNRQEKPTSYCGPDLLR